MPPKAKGEVFGDRVIATAVLDRLRPPEDYDPELASTFHDLIDKLDPSASAG